MAMSSSAPRQLVTRVLEGIASIGIGRRADERNVMASAMAMVARGLAETGSGRSARRVSAQRHPMAPSAIRVERGHGRTGSGRSRQAAVTMWFGGDGPALPGPASGASPALRAVVRIGVGALAAAALAAATTIAARVDEPRIVDGVSKPQSDPRAVP